MIFDNEFYSMKKILEKNAQYNLIFGERSNGKTYGALEEGLTRYFKDGGEIAIIRRFAEDFRAKRASSLFSSIVSNGVIARLSNGLWTGVHYYSGRWYFSRKIDNDTIEKSEEPFAYAFALTQTEHDKSTSFPYIKWIIFDEAITRDGYLTNEFIMFMNTVSTIIRHRTDVVINMLGNTVNKYCPYFKEMGLVNITKMKQGSIEVYKYGDTNLKVAVEYCNPTSKKSKGNKEFFAFDNPKLNMITGGAWELAVYPHLPHKYSTNDILLIFFIVFEDSLLQCEIVDVDGNQFIFIHEKTTPLKDEDNDLIFSTDFSHRKNRCRKLTKPKSKIEKIIANFFVDERVFYQTNEIGEIVRNYFEWCRTDKIT